MTPRTPHPDAACFSSDVFDAAAASVAQQHPHFDFLGGVFANTTMAAVRANGLPQSSDQVERFRSVVAGSVGESLGLMPPNAGAIVDTTLESVCHEIGARAPRQATGMVADHESPVGDQIDRLTAARRAGIALAALDGNPAPSTSYPHAAEPASSAQAEDPVIDLPEQSGSPADLADAAAGFHEAPGWTPVATADPNQEPVYKYTGPEL